MALNKILLGSLIVGMLVSCSSKKKSQEEIIQNSRFRTYKGTLKVAADEGLASILNQQIEVFESYHDSVNVEVSYLHGEEIFQDFKTERATLMLLARPMEKSEMNDFIKTDTLYVKQLPLAYDGVALIGNKNFKDDSLNVDLLKKYFNPSSSSDVTPRLVFENQNSSIVRFVLGYFGYKEKVSKNVYAMKSSAEVLSYVSENENAIGFVPFNIISDTDNDSVKKILKRIKILSLRAKIEEGEWTRVSANQSDIAAGIYPLIRTVTVVTRQTFDDNLEALFVTFLSKEKGARIFLKAGLVPVTIPEREINVNVGELMGGK